jgi:hypothetical protein
MILFKKGLKSTKLRELLQVREVETLEDLCTWPKSQRQRTRLRQLASPPRRQHRLQMNPNLVEEEENAARQRVALKWATRRNNAGRCTRN